MLKIAKKDEWVVPQGIHQGWLREIKQPEKIVNGTLQIVLRLVWQLDSIRSPRCNYVAGKNYITDSPERFEADMISWLGEDFYQLLDDDGTLVLSKLEALIGHPAEIQITQIVSGDHPKPFSHICSIKPVEKAP